MGRVGKGRVGVSEHPNVKSVQTRPLSVLLVVVPVAGSSTYRCLINMY